MSNNNLAHLREKGKFLKREYKPAYGQQTILYTAIFEDKQIVIAETKKLDGSLVEYKCYKHIGTQEELEEKERLLRAKLYIGFSVILKQSKETTFEEFFFAYAKLINNLSLSSLEIH